MRFRVSAKLEGNGVAAHPLEVIVGDLRVGTTSGDKGYVQGIWIDLPVPDYTQWMPSMTRGDGTPSKPHQFSFPDPPQADRLLGVLQYVESLGSFWLGIKRIHWAEAKWEWLPESDEERARLPVFSINRKLGYERRPIPFRAQVIRELIAAQQKDDWLVIPMSFLREATNDYEAHRYVNAFYNTYFFLEDIFGHAKTQNRDVLKAFKSSAELKSAVLKAYAACGDSPQKVRSLAKLMTAVGGDQTAEGLLKFLVKMRGELHHFSRHSSRPKGHPLNQHEFQPLAFFSMGICLNVLPKLITASQEPESA